MVILVLIAFSWGTRSASTKFCANEATSTPEPAPKELIRLCAAALLAAAVCAAVDVAFLDVAAVDVVVAVVVPVLELTAVVAMWFFKDR